MRPYQTKIKEQRKAKQLKKQGKERLSRSFFLFLIFGLLGVALMGRLIYVQIWESHELVSKASQFRNQSLVLYNRGRILDRNGVILAQDTILYDLYAHPQYYFKSTPDQIASALAPVLSRSEESLKTLLRKKHKTLRVANNLSKSVMDNILKTQITLPLVDPKTKVPLTDGDGQPLIRKMSIPGMDFSKKAVRNYPQGALGAHILGYVNDEAEISSGVEYSARSILKKKPTNMMHAELDGRGRVIDVANFDPEAMVKVPKADDVTLTLDLRLQYIAERELAAGMKRSGGRRGAVIMMAPKTGEILAFAVTPKYDPARYFQANASTLKNWAITDVYPPGSTMKILTVASGLDSGVIHKDSRILDTGKMKIGGWTIQNYDYHKHRYPGMINLIYLLQHSSNIASAKVALMIPKEKQRELLQRFGVGRKTGIDLPGESSGILLPLSNWDESTHASIGYGYGIAMTPLQMASAVSTIANGGIWNKPYFIQNNHEPVKRRVISKIAAETTTELMATAIAKPKKSSVRLEGIRVAGKTGTSKRPKDNGRGYTNQRYTSFVGYYPAEAPKILMLVVVDSPTQAEAWGSTVAGPIFKAIAQETISYLGLTPAKISFKSSE